MWRLVIIGERWKKLENKKQGDLLIVLLLSLFLELEILEKFRSVIDVGD
jgi:hypothetical protein